jgi:uncharacterized protein DUF3427
MTRRVGGPARTLPEGVYEDLLASRPSIVRELDELREVLEDRVGLASQALPVPGWSLALHCHYSRREIAAGIGYVTAGDKAISLQTGILKLEDERRELLFVTLDKSGKSFSPTTRYRDYASSPAVFHWETQAAASASRPSGAAMSRARPTAGPASCSCGRLPTRPSPSSARSPTSRTLATARSRSRGASRRRCRPSCTSSTPRCARGSPARARGGAQR